VTVRVAGIDCGTNSIRLLVADIDADAGALVDVDRRMRIVRLGQGVDSTGMLAPEALERTFAACSDYAAIITESGATQVRFVATSATRDASNRNDFVDGIRRILKVEPEVVSGQEEARLSFSGATAGLVSAIPPFLVVDIGGGSTEFVLGAAEPTTSCSVNIGCVRMTERHFAHPGGPVQELPPTPGQIGAALVDIDAAIGTALAAVPLSGTHTFLGLAGSVTTVAAIALGLTAYDSTAIHGSRISLATVSEISHRLLGMTRAERAAIPVMHEGRVDVIAAGALILRRAMELTNSVEVLVSEHDILDGIALSLAP
jgi:exopolyphosphatase/guanosine-5'-triphosphate,3'-diphosphate pyrophosphatase